MSNKRNIDRTPREYIRQPDVKDIMIEVPPQIDKKNKEKIYPVIIQCIVAVLNFSIISFIVSKDINTSLLCTTITSIGSLFTILITNRIEKKATQDKRREMRTKYINYLADIKSKIEIERTSFDAYYDKNYPSIHDCIKRIEIQPPWDRFIGEPDFLLVRIGYHQFREFDVVYQSNALSEDDFEVTETINEIKKFGYTDVAPILLDISNTTIGFWGTKDALLQMFIRILIDCTFHHCYTDLKFVIIDPDGDFSWLSNLSFFQDSSEGKNLYASTHKEITNVLTYIRNVITKRENSLLSNGEDSSTPVPYYVICVFTERAGKLLAINSIPENKHISISWLHFYSEFRMLSNCKIKVKCETDTSIIQKSENTKFRTEIIDRNEVVRYINLLSSFKSESVSGFSLPNSISIFDGYGITEPEELNILNRWNENKCNAKLAVPVGINELGQLFEIDLHELEDGPHCVVAGSTGSGKSEFLTTMILSYAINYSPEKVLFWVFDGKGGGLISYLKKLPHISKSITQLDENVFDEVAHSLKDELRRRQMLLQQYGTRNIETHNKNSNCPLPHLFIIVDEIAEIKVYYPEFMDQLMSAARIGRALGIHLVLSTQKPSGVISDQIYANCKSRICFRTYDRQDSLELLRSPIATTFINSGRAAIKVGDDLIPLFQTFWSEASSKMESVPQSKILAEHISKIYSGYNSD